MPVYLTCVTAWLIIVPWKVSDGGELGPTNVPLDGVGQSGSVNSHFAKNL